VGLPGLLGTAGNPGPIGPTGLPGSAGVSISFAGPPGPIGPTGNLGSVNAIPGFPGAPGATGPDGQASTVIGPPGSPGTNGRNGYGSTVPGPTGPTGPRGANGQASRYAGSPGTNGVPGTNGLNGNPGAQGLAGTSASATGLLQGPQGDPNTQPGPTGPMGAPGTFGAMGSSGIGDAKVVKILGNIGTTGQVFLIMSTGRIFSSGYNQYGLSGLGSSFTSAFFPLSVSAPTNVLFTDGAVNNQVACFIGANNTQLWCLGQNQFGQLGVGSTNPPGAPFFGSSYTRVLTQVLLPTNTIVTKVIITGSAGSEACLALTAAGTVLSWGFNGNYVIGYSTTNPRLTPNNVKATSSSILSNVIDILTNPEGNSWVVALVNNGAVYSGNPSLCVSNCDCGSGGCDVYTWGNMGNGQLGRNAAVGDQGYALIVSAKARAVALQGGNGGVGSTCIINYAANALDSTVSCWGYNGNGECGTGDTLSPNFGPRQVGLPADNNFFKASSIISNGGDVYGYYCAVRLVETAVYCWGYNYFGNVGSGTGSSPSFGFVTVPTKVVGYRFGSDTSWNYNITAVVTTPGRNSASCCGYTGASASYLTTCALRGDGTVWCWGYNGNGNLGTPSDSTARNFAMQLPYLSNIVTIAMIGSDQNYHTLYAIERDNTVWSLGYNGRYTYGTGDAINHQWPRRMSQLQV